MRRSAALFLIVAAFVITNKVYSPQYSLWLVPLAVLALYPNMLVVTPTFAPKT